MTIVSGFIGTSSTHHKPWNTIFYDTSAAAAARLTSNRALTQRTAQRAKNPKIKATTGTIISDIQIIPALVDAHGAHILI